MQGPRGAERVERNQCKSMGWCHTSLFCAHWPVKKPSETQWWFYHNLFSTGHVCSMAIITLDSLMIALFQVELWKDKARTLWWCNDPLPDCSRCTECLLVTPQKAGPWLWRSKVENLKKHTLTYVTKRRAGGWVENYMREWVLVSPLWHFEVTALLCAI